MSTGMNMLLDFFIACYGGYLIYAAVVMKRTGKIQNTMLSKGVNLTGGEDVEGYIRHTFGISLAVGVLCVCVGAIGLYNDYYGGLGRLHLAAILVFGISLLVYGVLMMRAQKTYLQG